MNIFYDKINWVIEQGNDGKRFIVFTIDNKDKISVEMANGNFEELIEKIKETMYKYYTDKINKAIEQNSNAIVADKSTMIIDGETILFEELERKLRINIDELINTIKKESSDFIDGEFIEIDNNLKNKKKLSDKLKISSKNVKFFVGGIVLTLAVVGGYKCSKDNEYNNKNITPIVKENETDIEDTKEVEVVTPTVTPIEKTTVTPVVEEIENVAEEAIKFVTYDEFIETTNKFANDLKKKGIKNVNPASINSMQFIANIQNINNETYKKLVENNVIREDAIKIIEDSFELYNVVKNNAYAGKFINLSPLSHDEEGKKLIDELTSFVERMYSQNDTEKKNSLLDLHAFVSNNNADKVTSLPFLRMEISEGTDYVAGIYAEIGYAFSSELLGVKDIRTVIYKEYSKINNIYRYIEKCILDKTDSLEEEKVKDK